MNKVERLHKIRPAIVRFNEKYTVNNNGCWNWHSSLDGRYGIFYLNGKHEKAHRASYRMFIGEIGVNKCICHKCDNPICVNPDHLFAADQKENIKDMISKGRNVRGSMSHHAKLSPKEVMAIRAIWSTGKLNQYEIAQAFSTTQENISKIVNRLKWKDLI